MSYVYIQICGNLGRDPEIRMTPQGESVANFSIAVNERKRDKATGEYEDTAQWYNVTVWGKTAETCAKYLSKGSLVSVLGTPSVENWTDRDGRVRTNIKVNSIRVDFLSKANSDGNSQPDHHQPEQPPQYGGSAPGQGIDDEYGF